MGEITKNGRGMTIGVDLGDKWSRFCVLDEQGEVCEEGRIASTARAMRKRFRTEAPSRIVIGLTTSGRCGLGSRECSLLPPAPSVICSKSGVLMCACRCSWPTKKMWTSHAWIKGRNSACSTLRIVPLSSPCRPTVYRP